MLQFSCEILGNILWGSETGILYYFIVDKPQTNVFVAFVFLQGELARQQVAFREKARKIRGFGSLRVDFYTKFIPIFKDFGL